MQIDYTLTLIILGSLIAAALWTIMTRSLIRSALGLAATSAVLTLIMFRFHSWLAGVFELSVCAGLISVVFISTISLTQPLSKEEVIKHMYDRRHRFRYLPLILVAVAIGLSLVKLKLDMQLPAGEIENDPRKVLWYARNVDLLGQVIIMLSGIFGVITLFREMRRR
jgi:NADH-quinone oxidoreductase subunit J